MRRKALIITRGVAAAAAIGLLLSGCIETGGEGGDGSDGSGISRKGDAVAAQVSGTKIYESDVRRAAIAQKLIEADAPLTTDNPAFKKTLDELIDQRLLSLAAFQQGLDQKDEVKRRFAVARERTLSSMLVEQHLRETVNERTIRQMYDAQAGLRNRGEEVRARHILVATEDEIKAAAAKLAAGGDFGELAAKLSVDRATKDSGGDLGFFTSDALAPEFTQVAFSASQGELSKPFKTAYGWHVLEVTGRRKAPQPSFESMHGQLQQFMTYDEIQKLVTRLRGNAEVTVLMQPPPQTEAKTESEAEAAQDNDE